MTEIWKPVPDTKLEASSLGRIRVVGDDVALETRPHRHDSRYAYQSVRFRRYCEGKSVFVHRLVCEAFHGAPPAGHEVDRIDRDKSNNRPENLRWLTKSQNLARRDLPSGEGHWGALLTVGMVRVIRNLPPYRGSDADLASIMNVTRETIRDVRTGATWRNGNE